MASRDIAFKFINSRKVPFAELAADLAVGYKDEANRFVGLFVIPDFLLKKSQTKGYYYQGPSKPYIKGGVHQKDAQGYSRYLEFFKLFTEKGAGDDPNKHSPTKAAFDARKYLIGLFVDELKTLGGDTDKRASTPAPSARKQTRSTPARNTRSATAATVIEEDGEIGVPDGSDDEIPF